MGHNMKHALDFATRYPGWHTFRRDRATRRAVSSLFARGLVDINRHGQFRAV